MSDESALAGPEAIVDALEAANKLLLATHVHPDGDALGSMVALAAAARQAGKSVDLLLPEGAPERYAFLLGDFQPIGLDQAGALAQQADWIVVLDTHAQAQLEDLWDLLTRHNEKVLVVDHHPTGKLRGKASWIDTSASAVGVQTLELLQLLGWKWDRDQSLALATAITSDTGWLRFENTDGRTLRAMACLVDAGVAPDRLYARLFQQDRPERLALLARALAWLELLDRQRIAVMRILESDFRQTGARTDETENLVNESLRIATVEVAIMLVEQEGRVRVSLRSRGDVDVSRIAAEFGGGGHARAAGLRSDLPLAALKEQLIAATREALSS